MSTVEEALTILVRDSCPGDAPRRACEALAIGLGHRWVGVCRLTDPGHAQVLASWRDGAPGEIFAFPLEEDPGAPGVPAGPGFAFTRMVPISGPDGGATGLVWLAHDEPIAPSAAEEALLTLVAQRLSGDLVEGPGDTISGEAEAECHAREVDELLSTAIDSLTETIVIYDAEERLRCFNKSFRELNREFPELARVGLTAEDYHRIGLERGVYLDAIGCEERWLTTRMARFRDPGETFEIQRSNGSRILVRDHRLPNGGTATTSMDVSRLRGAQARLHDAIEALDQGFLLFGPDDRLVLRNERMAEIAPDVQGLLQPGIHVDELFEAASENRRLADDESPTRWLERRRAFYRQARGTFEQRHADGRWIRIEGRRTSEGGVVELHSDITNRRRAEELLLLREQQLAEAQDLGLLGHWSWDAAADRLDASSEFHRILGRAEGDTRRFGDFLDAVHEEDRASFLALRDVASLGPEGFRGSLGVRRPDGEARYLEVAVRARVGIGGEAPGLLGVVQDVTERREIDRALADSERRYRQIFDFVPFALYVHDGDIILQANPMAAEIHGYESPAEMMGTSIRDHIHPDDLPRFDQRSGDLRRREGQLPFVEYRRVRPDGGIVVVEQSGTAFPWRGEQQILAVDRDVTRERAVEEQLRQAQKMEAIGQLTGGIAHDFNNLLSVIQGNILFLRRQLEEGDPRLELTRPVIRAVQRGASLTHRLLAFARQQPLDIRPVDVNALLIGLEELLRRTFQDDIVIELSLAEDLWISMADAVQLEQAILNLANNARDAMPAGGKLILETRNIAIRAEDRILPEEMASGDYIVIAITDTGTGIAAEQVERVFEPFYTTKEVGKGTGLGLSMVFGFAKQSRGHIGVYSEAGIGTTMRLYLPRAAATASALPEPPAPAATRPSIAGSERILLVEDDADVRRMTKTLLQDLGYRVTSVRSGPAASELLSADRNFDLLVADVMLPDGMNGPATAAQARELVPGLRVVYISGFADESRDPIGPLGAEAKLLAKPFLPEDLGAMVRAALDE